MIHTSRLVDIRQRLPILIDWVDSAERVERLLPRVKEMIKHGLITVDDTDVAFFCPLPVRDVPSALRACDVVSREVLSVTRDTAVRTVVELMLGKIYRAIPVVDAGVPVGIITDSDLVNKGGLTIRVELLSSLDTPELHAELERLTKGAKTAADVVTAGPVTIGEMVPLTQAAEVMAFRRLKRLPVVDERGALWG